MLNIKQRQQNLQTYYLFYNGKIDGIEGVNTKKAYRSFQKFVGITVDGIYGRNPCTPEIQTAAERDHL